MKHQKPQPGLIPLMEYLQNKGLKKALCTRNFETPVNHLIENYLSFYFFDPIITRDTLNLLPKPYPDGILFIAKEWGLFDRGDSLIMVSIIHIMSSRIVRTLLIVVILIGIW